MATASATSLKEDTMNEAGDRAIASALPTGSSHNDELEEIASLAEISWESDDDVMRKLEQISHEVRNQGRALLSRSDFAHDWRNRETAATGMPAASAGMPMPAVNPTKLQTMSKFFLPMVTKKPLVLTGPNEEKIRSLLNKTGYSLTVSARQRTYGGPPPGWTGPAPGKQSQIFFGKVPKQIFEDTLVPLFEQAGRIYEMRIMMEGAPSVISRGFGFVVYTNAAAARKAERRLDNIEILPKYRIKVAVSEPICRLFICQIPKHLSDSDVEREIDGKLRNVTSVEHKASKGFCFVTFEDHVSAAQAKKEIGNNSVKLFRVKVGVDFADQIPEPDEKSMSEVKAVHVTGFPSWTTDAELVKMFELCGVIEKAKKLPNYAFIHFKERSGALNAIERFHNQEHEGRVFHVTLAKPPVAHAVKEEALIRRAKRLENQKKGMYAGPQTPLVPPGFRDQIPVKDGNMFVVKHGVVVSDGKQVFVFNQG